MAVNVDAVVILVVFYLIILAVGLLAAYKVKVKGNELKRLETSLVAGRDLKTSVGIFTMIATTVGGGYINGTAEEVARSGLVWTLAPLGIFIGLNLGGALFARKMREGCYLTMLDPFQTHYGNLPTLLIYLASLTGDLLWTASILNALGSTLSVIADIELTVAVVVSGSVTIAYTMAGSMISVAYTDVVQMIFIVLGLVTSLPFVFSNDKIGSLSESKDTWLGSVPSSFRGLWADLLVAMTLGTIPWQAYFQRVLSMKSARQAQMLSFVAALGALVLAVPPVLLGIAGASADWSNTTFGESPIGTDESNLILPLVINEFTPSAVSLLGLGAISAAVMSSMDSSILATSSMFTHNIYHEMFRSKASPKELRVVQISAVIFFGCVAMGIAVWVSVIYGIFILAADIVFVIIFPQLTAVLYLPSYVNTSGSIAGFFVGLVLRIGAGEPIIDLPAWIRFPFYSDEDGQLFPFRTVSMLLSFIAIVLVTALSKLDIWDRVLGSCCFCLDGGKWKHWSEKWLTGRRENVSDSDIAQQPCGIAHDCIDGSEGDPDKMWASLKETEREMRGGEGEGESTGRIWVKCKTSEEEVEMDSVQGQFRRLP
ncbi:high-affinity choline transporter 1-like [Plakobranchus ocellatus]|uniref:High-affinity choline transporter 1-like n=1 Tax=Plakobranchus ocellatus TaxID=259542 RepID=A0AAV3Y8C6_9GAST|nr:high-affinity choline transporter 1-like [Plakobranchus ocellatus]